MAEEYSGGFYGAAAAADFCVGVRFCNAEVDDSMYVSTVNSPTVVAGRVWACGSGLDPNCLFGRVYDQNTKI